MVRWLSQESGRPWNYLYTWETRQSKRCFHDIYTPPPLNHSFHYMHLLSHLPHCTVLIYFPVCLPFYVISAVKVMECIQHMERIRIFGSEIRYTQTTALRWLYPLLSDFIHINESMFYNLYVLGQFQLQFQIAKCDRSVHISIENSTFYQILKWGRGWTWLYKKNFCCNWLKLSLGRFQLLHSTLYSKGKRGYCIILDFYIERISSYIPFMIFQYKFT